MLEGFADIYTIETTLQEYLPKSRLIGQIPLETTDIEIINSHIKHMLAGTGIKNLDDVILNTPTIFACYLVWKGIQNYDEGAYWSSLKDELRDIDPNHQKKIGLFFQDFIEKNGLLSINIPGSRQFITPILLHGIIPQEMVPDFFENIIYPLTHKQLINPTDEIEIEEWLEERRETMNDWSTLEGLQSERKKVSHDLHFLNIQDSDHLENKLEDICLRTQQEKVELLDLIMALSSTHFDPDHFQSLKEQLNEAKQLNEEYQECISNLENLQVEYDRVYQDLEKYRYIGLDNPDQPCDLESYREIFYSSIIIAIDEAIKDTDQKTVSWAKDLLEEIYAAMMSGSLGLPLHIEKKIIDLYHSLPISLTAVDRDIDLPEMTFDVTSDSYFIDDDIAERPQIHGLLEDHLVQTNSFHEMDPDEWYAENIIAPYIHAFCSWQGTSRDELANQSENDAIKDNIDKYSELCKLYLLESIPEKTDVDSELEIKQYNEKEIMSSFDIEPKENLKKIYKEAVITSESSERETEELTYVTSTKKDQEDSVVDTDDLGVLSIDHSPTNHVTTKAGEYSTRLQDKTLKRKMKRAIGFITKIKNYLSRFLGF